MCVCNKTRTTAMHASLFLQTWNGFEINPSKDNNQIRQQIIGHLVKLQTTLFWCAGSSTTSLSHLYIKEWRLREWKDSYNNLQVLKLCWNCSASKVHLEFLIKVHILEILEFVSNLYCEHHWLYIKCSTSNIFLCNSVWIEVSCLCAWA